MPTPQNTIVHQVAAALASGTQAQALAHIDEIAAYCRAHENGRVLSNYDEAQLRLLVAYHQAKGTISVIRNREGAIAGVHLWYRCRSDWEFSDVLQWTPDEPESDAIFMAFLYASETGAMQEMVHDFLRKEPDGLIKRLITSRFKGGAQVRIDRDVRYLHKILTLKGEHYHGRR